MDESIRLQYEIRIRGELGDTLLAGFPGFDAVRRGGETVLAGVLPDQAALFGVINQIEVLGLELLEVRRDRQTDEPGKANQAASRRVGGADTRGDNHG